ncbi:hypothetical protein VP01_596g1 [Puccinia sorghi]|uniref:Uncharacterized protein n=1 Tax=Puccinia sorghi TaxID=27349 RepID=A0A0L6UHK4_9BASI|nr:hypothetical protein VP01_596g1 [Puccinia sorghi]
MKEKKIALYLLIKNKERKNINTKKKTKNKKNHQGREKGPQRMMIKKKLKKKKLKSYLHWILFGNKQAEYQLLVEVKQAELHQECCIFWERLSLHSNMSSCTGCSVNQPDKDKHVFFQLVMRPLLLHFLLQEILAQVMREISTPPPLARSHVIISLVEHWLGTKIITLLEHRIQVISTYRNNKRKKNPATISCLGCTVLHPIPPKKCLWVWPNLFTSQPVTYIPECRHNKTGLQVNSWNDEKVEGIQGPICFREKATYFGQHYSGRCRPTGCRKLSLEEEKNEDTVGVDRTNEKKRELVFIGINSLFPRLETRLRKDKIIKYEKTTEIEKKQSHEVRWRILTKLKMRILDLRLRKV